MWRRFKIDSATGIGVHMLHVTSVKYLKDYSLWLSFDDGSQGLVDLSSHLRGTMFEPLKDRELFAKVRFDEEIETAVWPNGADLAPEFLRSLLTK